MTGEKNRGTNLSKHFNIEDDDLDTPEHDALVLAANEKYLLDCAFPEIATFYKSMNGWGWPLKYKNIISKEVALEGAFSSQFSRFAPKFSGAHEYVIRDGAIYRKGTLTEEEKRDTDIFCKKMYEIADREIEVSKTCNKLYLDATAAIQKFNLNDMLCLDHEQVIKTSYNNFIIGFWDIVVTIPQTQQTINIDGNASQLTSVEYPWRFYIEAKPKIRSYGATLRQIKLYKEFLPHPNMSIVCLLTPDLRFKDAFEKQGIRVLYMEQPELP